MTNRGAPERVFSTMVLSVALWAWSGGAASAQICELCPPPTPGIVQCAPPPECTEGCPQPSPDCTASYTPDQKVNVFTFGTDNSLQVRFGEVCTTGFNVTVKLVPVTQAIFHERLKSSPS